MIPIEEALRLVDEHPLPKKKWKKNLLQAMGCVLAESVQAPLSLPPFDNSAMDGYALCGSTQVYELTGELKAGDTHAVEMKEGTAVRIFTGAQVPKYATAVVMQEKTRVTNNQLVLEEIVPEGANIRRRGEEIRQGDVVLEAGHLLTPASVGLLSSLGLLTVAVYQSPTVAILTTGDELVTPGQPLMDGQIYEGNSATLHAALLQMGIEPVAIEKVKDDQAATTEAVRHLLERSDLLLISGGISVGDYDFVKKALEENGVTEVFYKVQQKPGKPLFFGKKGDKRVLALPGNPGSLLTCFYVYVRRLLLEVMNPSSRELRQHGKLAHDKEVKGIRPIFYRAAETSGRYEILDKQGSSMLHAFAHGDAIVLLHPGHNPAGEMYQVWRY